MIYIYENIDNNASIVYDASYLTEENISKGIALESLPMKYTPEGKQAILKCRKSTNEVWWEYIDIPGSKLSERVGILETTILSLMDVILMGGM